MLEQTKNLMNHHRYKARKPLVLNDRRWPDQVLNNAPVWCSVDLRDGNQALEIPMSLEEKLDFFKALIRIGFKNIEVGFPAASETEFAFVRELIEGGHIPDDVTIQILTQARPHIIERSFEALRGVRHAIVHLYNSTSTTQREKVFNMSRQQVIDLAVSACEHIKKLASEISPDSRIDLEYSPESFSLTEPDFALEICTAVLNIWEPTAQEPIIFNLPNTVETSSPNVYADQIEYFCRHIPNRESVIVSVHTHNDRGCAVAASELGLLAGAQRVEGTLFGNGERTGNADILTLAMNLFSQGIDPELDFSRIADVVNIYERCTRMKVNPRQPYAGDLVYTAFSGSHQDAISKAMKDPSLREHWDVPYLPIDPADVGRNYDPVIRINSQSGKGGVSFILEHSYGLILPKAFQVEFSAISKQVSDARKTELRPQGIKQLFDDEYVNILTPLRVSAYKEETLSEHSIRLNVEMEHHNKTYSDTADGPGLVEAFVQILRQYLNERFDISLYHQQALGNGAASKAMTYVQVQTQDGEFNGCGLSSSISRSSLRAIVSAINRYLMCRDKQML